MKSFYRRIKEVIDHVFFKFFNKLIKRYANNTFSRIWVFVADLLMVVIAYYATRLMYGNLVTKNYHVAYYLPILLLIYSVMFLVFSSYKGMLRYSGFGDLRRLLAVAIGALVLLLFFRNLASRFSCFFSRSILHWIPTGRYGCLIRCRCWQCPLS